LFQIYKRGNRVVADMLCHADWFELQLDTNWSCTKHEVMEPYVTVDKACHKKTYPLLAGYGEILHQNCTVVVSKFAVKLLW